MEASWEHDWQSRNRIRADKNALEATMRELALCCRDLLYAPPDGPGLGEILIFFLAIISKKSCMAKDWRSCPAILLPRCKLLGNKVGFVASPPGITRCCVPPGAMKNHQTFGTLDDHAH